jgi:hypothetical protein
VDTRQDIVDAFARQFQLEFPLEEKITQGYVPVVRLTDKCWEKHKAAFVIGTKEFNVTVS